ncbi:hypothetical protein Tco_0134235 [Tanacetum coccineum]
MVKKWMLKKDGIFISQDKYVEEILKKFRFTEVKTASTPIETQKPLLKDENGEEVDVHMYRSMIGSLMYLTSSRPDIMFAVCACARYQVNPKVSHLHAVKRIFRYLKGQPKLGLWYLKDSPFDLVAYTDSDYAGASLDRKSTIGGKAKKSVKLMMEKLFRMELELMLVKTINGESQLHALVDGKKIIITESSVRRDLQLADENGIDCLPNSTIFEQLTLMGFVQVFLEQQLDDLSTHNRIYVAPSHTKKIFANMRRVGKGFSGRVTPLFPTIMVQNQSQMGKGPAIPNDPHHTPTIIQPSTQPQKTQKPRKPRKDTQVPQPSDPPESVTNEVVHKELGDSLVRAATTASSLEAEKDSGNINKTQSKATHNESSSLGTTLGGGPRCQETMGDTIAQTRFENVSKHSNDSLLAKGNIRRSDEDRLKLDELMALRVKKLRKKNRSRTHKLKRLYKVGLTAKVESSDNEESLDEEMFDVNVLDGDEVFVAEQEVAVNKENDEVNVVEEVVQVSAAGNVVSTAGDATTTGDDGDITLAQARIKMKSTKPKNKEKRAGTELIQENAKKQKVKDDKETVELK